MYSVVLGGGNTQYTSIAVFPIITSTLPCESDIRVPQKPQVQFVMFKNRHVFNIKQ